VIAVAAAKVVANAIATAATSTAKRQLSLPKPGRLTKQARTEAPDLPVNPPSINPPPVNLYDDEVDLQSQRDLEGVQLLYRFTRALNRLLMTTLPIYLL